MGKNHSKIMHSISVNFGVLNKKGGNGTKDSSELSLVKLRSNSLDSVSTALSFGMGHGQTHPLNQVHSCSVDDLQNSALNSTHNEGSSKAAVGRDRSAGQSCTRGGHRYTLVESTSVASSSNGEEEGESPQRGFTQSLPAEIERKITMGSKVRTHPPKERNKDLDCFSDNFVVSPQESKTPRESKMLKRSEEEKRVSEDDPPLQQEASSTMPLPPSLLNKLSPEEMTEFISFVCATLGHSLRSSISDQQRGEPCLNENTTAGQTSSTRQTRNSTSVNRTRHVHISDERDLMKRERKSLKMASHLHNCREQMEEEEMWSRNHERPSSLPSLHLRENPEILERLQALRREEEQEVGGADSPPDVVRSRSKSQDDCFHGNWTHHHSRQRSSHQHQRCSHGSGKKRRTAAGRQQRERNGRVDISLDDNCPGLRQNRVGRRGGRHGGHQQAVCDHCLEKFGGSYSPSRRRQRDSPTGERVCEDSPGSRSGEEMGEAFMTLQDMKKVTSDFLKGTNDLDEAVIQDLKMQFLRGMEEQRRHNTERKSGPHCLRLDAIQPSLSRNRPRTKSFHLTPVPSKGATWRHLAFPTEPRTGQDSPRTDMAVFNLDLNSTVMCQPVVVSDPGSVKDIPSTVEGKGHLYLHKHHHIHHIIHHSQP